MALVYGVGNNDMPKGWYLENRFNRKVYDLWHEMLRKCYTKKRLDKQPTYENVTVCERWFSFKNFCEDLPKVPGYDDWMKSLAEKKPLHFVVSKKEYRVDTVEFTRHATKRKMFIEVEEWS